MYFLFDQITKNMNVLFFKIKNYTDIRVKIETEVSYICLNEVSNFVKIDAVLMEK